MKEIEITREEFEQIRKLHSEKNRKTPVSFSTNIEEQIWLSPYSGFIPPDKREYVEHLSKRLDEVARIYVERRDDRERAGGKFFIDWEGGFWKDEDGNRHRFIQWKSAENLRAPIKQPTYAQLREMSRH